LEFWRAMRGYAATGRTLLFTTHYLEEVDQNAGRIVVISGGRVVDGAPEQIRKVAGASTVRFTLAGAPAGLPVLPGVVDLDIRGHRVTVRTNDPDATGRALAVSGLPWHDVTVSAASLDDAFLTLSREER
jgi:ABC-2 type transport system ATP-binding protein